MKNLIYLFAIVAFVFTSCEKDDPVVTPEPFLLGEFETEKYVHPNGDVLNSVEEKRRYYPDLENIFITLNFKKDGTVIVFETHENDIPVELDVVFNENNSIFEITHGITYWTFEIKNYNQVTGKLELELIYSSLPSYTPEGGTYFMSKVQ